MQELITNRTAADVERCKALAAKGWSNMTEAERAEWYGVSMRGAYNYSDLNRVESAVAELSEFLELGLATKTDWGMWDVPTHADMSRYISNLQTIKERCLSIGEIPTAMNGLTYEVANNIEKMLLEAYQNKDTHDVWQKSTATVEYVKRYTSVDDHPKIGTTGEQSVYGAYQDAVHASRTWSFSEDKGFYGESQYYPEGSVIGYYNFNYERTECRKITSVKFLDYVTEYGYTYVYEYKVVGYATVKTVPVSSAVDFLGCVLIPRGVMPEGTLVEGSYDDGYCVVRVGNEYYYYVKR